MALALTLWQNHMWQNHGLPTHAGPTGELKWATRAPNFAFLADLLLAVYWKSEMQTSDTKAGSSQFADRNQLISLDIGSVYGQLNYSFKFWLNKLHIFQGPWLVFRPETARQLVSSKGSFHISLGTDFGYILKNKNIVHNLFFIVYSKTMQTWH